MAKSGPDTGDGAEEVLPDLGAFLVKAGQHNADLFFDGIELLELCRADDQEYQSSATIHAAGGTYMVTLDFDKARFADILSLLPERGAAQVRQHLAGPFVGPARLNFPPGALTVAVRARCGIPRFADGEFYVPLSVERVFRNGEEAVPSAGTTTH